VVFFTTITRIVVIVYKRRVRRGKKHVIHARTHQSATASKWRGLRKAQFSCQVDDISKFVISLCLTVLQ